MTTNQKISDSQFSDSIKKEARGNNDYDLGEVQNVGVCYVHTQRGYTKLTQFYIPKNLAKSYDGNTMYFDVSEKDAVEFAGSGPLSDNSCQPKYEAEVAAVPDLINKPLSFQNTSASKDLSDIVERIPLMTQRLDVSKHTVKEDVTITKIPYVEMQSKDIPVMHQVIVIERVKPSSSTPIQEASRGLTPEVIKVTLEHEVVDVTKTPEVREELLIHRKPITETHRVTEEIRSERFETSDNVGQSLEEQKKKRATLQTMSVS
jgi:uncharacterized protein (TIGR02271 family)